MLYECHNSNDSVHFHVIGRIGEIFEGNCIKLDSNGNLNGILKMLPHKIIQQIKLTN